MGAAVNHPAPYSIRTMSSTETLVDSSTLRETLRAYVVHETGEETASDQTSRQNAPARIVSDPAWPSDWRRTPAYRETSRVHRILDRAAGTNAVESVMVVAMFAGVWVIGVSEFLHTIHQHICWAWTWS